MCDVTKKFEKMGVKAEISRGPLRVDIKRDKEGKPVFELQSNDTLVVLDVDPKDKHLVLMERSLDKPKFLCGFDEQGWFAAPLPDARHVRWSRMESVSSRRGISDVESAKMALKPREVVEIEDRKKIKRKHRLSRVNKASKRQGEWFFIPDASLVVDPKNILKNEPIRMGRKREHMCSELYRTGGERVMVCSAYPNGLSDRHFANLDKKIRDKHSWRVMVRDAGVYVRGAISAPDHHTLHLECWHRVISNTEGSAVHAEKVAFLD